MMALILSQSYTSRSFRQEKLLNSKKSILRYMSHELLTPLNSAMLGMRLVSAHAEVFESGSLNETVADVSKSLACAVELLESLSCYDKIESSLMELSKEDNIPIVNLLEECVWAFSPQAVQWGVDLDLYTSVPSRGTDNESE
jgi:signal transduction histidine kinase